MMNKPKNRSALLTGQRRPAPVRVKIWDAEGRVAKVHPPDGESDIWWERAAARSPWGGVSELSMNAALAMIEAAAPKDEIEGALAIQLAITHTTAMAVLAKLDAAFVTERRVAAFGSAAARLQRAFANQVEVLRRLRQGGHQYVRVEHVHVSDGGQAVIGNVNVSSQSDSNIGGARKGSRK